VARYRFNWENLPSRLLRELADRFGLEGPPAASLRGQFGARPKVAFIADAWPILLDAWLPDAPQARVAIVEELRIRSLGKWEMTVKSKAEQLDYLHTCRNTTTLRNAALTQLILAGEADLAPIPKGKPAPPNSPDTRIETSDASDGPKASLKEFVDETLMAFLGTSEINRDDDGDIPIRFGSAMVYVRVDEATDRPSRVLFICPLVSGIPKSPELFESLNEINLQLQLGRVVLSEGRVTLEAELVADTMSPPELNWALDLVANASDYFDSKLVARFGGTASFDEEAEDGVEV
jgi:hypothetical protein